MPNRPNQSFGLPRLAALFSLILLLIGQGSAPLQQGNPADEPPPDAPTPAMLRAEDWAAEPAKTQIEAIFGPNGTEPDSVLAMETSFQCDRGSTSGRRNVYSNTAYSHYGYYDGDWEIRAGNFCTSSTHKRVTNNSAADYEPRLSYDAMQVVFVSNRDSNAEIYSAALADRINKRLTRDASTDTMPVFSPLGNKIAFVSDRSKYAEIYTMNTDGSGVTKLTNFHLQALHPDWSPDGSKIAFTLSNGRSGQIIVMDTNGKNSQALTGILPGLGKLRWSPSGKRIAFEYFADRGGWLDLGVVNADGSGLRNLLINKSTTDFELGSWSADEQFLIFNAVHYVYWRDQWYIDKADMQYMNDVDHSVALLPTTPGNDNLIGAFMSTDVVNGDQIAPISGMASLPDWIREESGEYPVTVWGKDEGSSGLWKIGAKCWADSIHGSGVSINPYGKMDAQFTSHIQIDAGYNYVCYTYAEDVAGNVQATPAEPEEIFGVYRVIGNGQVQDVREHPLGDVKLTAGWPAITQPLTDHAGDMTVYLAGNNYFKADFSHAGLGVIPTQYINFYYENGDFSFLTVLPGNDEQITNGHFTDPLINGWQPGNPGTLEKVRGRNGGDAARLNNLCTKTLYCPREHESVAQAPIGDAELDSQGAVHLVTSTGEYLIRDLSKVWQSGPALPEGEYSGLTIGPDDTLYITQTAPALQIYRKLAGGTWSGLAPLPAEVVHVPWAAIDDNGKLNIFYLYKPENGSTGLYKTALNDADTWELPGRFNIPMLKDDVQPYAHAGGDGSMFVAVARVDGYLAVVHILSDGTNSTEIIGNDTYATTTDHPRMAVGPDGTMYLAARNIQLDGQFTRFIIRISSRPPNGVWSGWTTIATGGYIVSSPRLPWGGIAVDGQNNVHVAVLKHPNAFENLIYMVLPNNNQGKWITENTRLEGNPSSLDFIFDAADHGLLFAGGTAGLTCWPVVSDQPGTATLSQTIHLQETMYKPTLSFFYRLEQQMPEGSTSSIEALVLEEDQEPALLVTHVGPTADWVHAWADLSPWLGKDIAVQFRMNQGQGDYPAQLLVDEVSVSSWKSPLLHTVTPGRVDAIPPEGLWIELEGENLMAGSRVFIDDQEAAVVEYDAETGKMRALVDPSTPMGVYGVRVEAPGGADETLRGALWIGKPQFLPMVVQ